MNVNDLLEYAVEESKKIKVGEVFLVRDLFKGYEWNRILRKDRLLLGTLYLNFIHQNKTSIEKTSAGQQKYKCLG